MCLAFEGDFQIGTIVQLEGPQRLKDTPAFGVIIVKGTCDMRQQAFDGGSRSSDKQLICYAVPMKIRLETVQLNVCAILELR